MKTHLFCFERLFSAVLGVALLNVIICGAVYGADYNYNIVTGEQTVDDGLADIDSDPSRLNKSGDGTLILNGTNTYTGGTLLTGGTIVLGNDQALSTWIQGGDGSDNVAFMNSQGIVTVTDHAATIKVLEDRTISNHFVIGIPFGTDLTENRTGSLKFDIAADKTLTIDGVVTTSTNSYLDDGGAINVNVNGLTGLNFTGGHLVFSNNQADFGGAVGIYGVPSNSLDFTGLQSITFSGNSANNNGGGIYANGSVTLGDNATFSGNSAGSSGGGIYAYGSVTLGDNATFSGNSANSDGGGGINAYDSVTLGSNATFSDNLANDWLGGGGIYIGAIDTSNTIDIGAHAYFANNQAQSASEGGGAINAVSDLTVRGNSFFSENLTDGDGGAIYAYGLDPSTLLLDTTNGVIAFSGNRSGVTNFTTPDGTANAIHLNMKTQLKLTGGGNVYFDDPISSDSFSDNSVLLDAGFTGFAQFQGDSMLQSNAYTTINGGTMRVVSGASYTNGSGAFTVGTGGTLAGGGTITTGIAGFTISGTINPDSKIFATPNWTGTVNGVNVNTFGAENLAMTTTESIGTLTLAGNAALNNATLAIDLGTTSDLIAINGALSGSGNKVDLQSWDIGTYTILTANSDVVAGNFGTPTFLGQTLPTGGREMEAMLNNVGGTTLTLTTAQDNNQKLYWRGVGVGVGENTWDMDSDRWTAVVGNSAETNFIARDYVVFDGYTTNRTVTVAGDGQQVSGMEITNGDYTFNGSGTIIGIDSALNLADTTGKLLLSTSGKTTMNMATDFEHGTHITNGTFVLGHDQALGTWQQNGDGTDNTAFMNSQGIVTVTNNAATIKVEEDRTISNHFVIGIPDATGLTENRSGSLTFDIDMGKTLTIDGVVTTSWNSNLENGGAINVNVPTSGTDYALNFTGGHLVFSNNRAYSGGAVGIYGTSNNTLNFTNLQSITFSGNSTYTNGGGIYASSDVTLGNNATFSGNSANSNGGGTYSFLGSVTLGNNATFSGNSANVNGGGIYGGSNVTLGNNATFSGNSANANGGGIYGGSNVTLGNNATFSGNSANSNGGGIYGGSNVTLGNNATFFGNSVSGGWGGGAIYTNNVSLIDIGTHAYFANNQAQNALEGGGAIDAASAVSIHGNSFFSGNLTSGNGGAIYAYGFNTPTLLLDTGTGDDAAPIAFSGNQSGVTNFTTPDGTANSIHLNENTQLKLTGSGNVYFDDPISGAGAGNSVLLDTGFAGFVQFKGDSVLLGDASTTLYGGTMRVVNGASYTNGSGVFTVGADATLAGGGTITASNGFTLSGTISPDSESFEIPTYTTKNDVAAGENYNYFGTETTTISDAKKIGMLTLTGNAVFSDATIQVDADATTNDKVIVTGAASIAAGKSLSLGVGPTASLVADSFDFNNTGTLNITSYSPGDYVSDTNLVTAIETTNGVTNFNSSVTVAGQATTDFLSASAFLDGNAVKVATGLRWYSTDPLRKAHGTFTIDGANTFTLGANLADTTANLDPAWNGNSLTKEGTGTLILTGTNSYTGTTLVQQGTLQLESDLASSHVVVNATLATVGNITVNSLVADGATINLSDLAQGDILTVTNTASFTNTTIAFDATGATAGTYTLINYGSTLSDVSEITITASNLEAGFAGTWSLDATGLVYTIFQIPQINYQEKYGPYLSRNGYRMAGLFDRLPSDHPFLDEFKSMSDAEIISAIENATGEMFADAMQGGVNLQRVFNRFFHKRKGFRRGSRNQVGILGQCGSRCADYEIWGQFTGGSHDRSNVGRYSGYDLSNYGVAFGFEKQLSNRWFGGVAFGYDNAHLKLDSRYAKDEFEAFRVSLYGGYTGDNWYTSGYAGYAKNWHDTKRNNPAAGFRNHAKYDDDIFSTGFELGKIYQTANGAQLLPSIGVHWIHLDSPEFTERGSAASALHVSKSHYDTVQLPIGARWNKTFTSRSLCPWSISWTPEVRAFYVAELSDERSGLYTAFASAAGAGSVYADSGSGGRNGGMFGAGVTAQLTTRISVGVDYDYEIWETYDRHNLLGSVVWRR